MTDSGAGGITYNNALVTGATSGIGRAIAIALCKQGLDVTALGRNAERLEALRKDHGMRVVAADIRDTTDLVAQIGDRTFDVLVSNAGILPTTAPFQEIEPEDIQAIVDTNLTATLRLARTVLPSMIEKKRGHLFFIGSIAGRWPHPNMAVYGASKAAISLFCDSLRCDLSGSGVRVSEICPGRVETNLYHKALDAERMSALYAGHQPIRPCDIADLLMATLKMPANVDVSRMEVFPTMQSVGGSTIVQAGGDD